MPAAHAVWTIDMHGKRPAYPYHIRNLLLAVEVASPSAFVDMVNGKYITKACLVDVTPGQPMQSAMAAPQ